MSRLARPFIALAACVAPLAAHASFLSGDTLDSFANFLAWFVIIVIPPVAIAVFLAIHVLPEKIAEKRHHPAKDSIKVLCILSLFFGGMLWPFAWLWAYTRPIGFKAIYGTEKHEDYYLEMGDKARAGKLTAEEIGQLRGELETMAARTPLHPELRAILTELQSPVSTIHPAPAATPARPAAPVKA
jgi:hypothetical protein